MSHHRLHTADFEVLSGKLCSLQQPSACAAVLQFIQRISLKATGQAAAASSRMQHAKVPHKAGTVLLDVVRQSLLHPPSKQHACAARYKDIPCTKLLSMLASCCRLAAQAAAQQAVQAQQAVTQTQHYVAQQPLQVGTLLRHLDF